MKFSKVIGMSAASAAAFMLCAGIAHAALPTPCQQTDRVYEQRMCLRVQRLNTRMQGHSLANPKIQSGAVKDVPAHGVPPVNWVASGLTLRRQATGIFVVRLRLDSPADVAGMQPGDEIRWIDGQPVKNNVSAADVENMLAGPEGSTVTVTVGRRNQGETDVTLTRVRQHVEDAAAEMQGRTAYISIRYFSKDAADTIAGFLADQAKVKNPHAVIVDLRQNPGGELDQVRRVLGMLLPGQTVVAQLQTKTSASAVTTSGSPLLPMDTPVVILAGPDAPAAVALVVGGLKTAADGRVTLIVDTSKPGRSVSPVFLLPDKNGLRPFTPPLDALLMDNAETRTYFDSAYVSTVAEFTNPSGDGSSDDAALAKALDLTR